MCVLARPFSPAPLALFAAVVLAPSPLAAQPIIADHQVVDDCRGIPPSYIDLVKQMWISVPGESHSTGYRIGPPLLQAIDPRFAVSVRSSGTPDAPTDQHLRVSGAAWGNITSATGWTYSYGEEDWFTTPLAIQRTKDGITYASGQGLGLSAMGFGWCWDMTSGPATQPNGVDPVHGVHWAGRSEGGPEGSRRWGLDAEDFELTGNSVSMDTYIDSVEQLVAHCTTNGYATRPFFTTGPADGGGENGYQRELKHQRIRDHVAGSSNRVLFDYADLLAWSDAGTERTTTWTPSGGTPHVFEILHTDNMVDLDGTSAEDGDHIGQRGAVRLARAMWWMLARLAGWNGVPDVVLTVDDAAVQEGSAGSPTLTFTVTLTGTPASSVTLDYATADGTATAGSDYTAISGSLSFAAGQTKNTVTVPVTADLEDEAAETVELRLSNASGAALADAVAIGTIRDDDDPTIAVSDVSVVEGDSGSTNAVFTVSLSRTTPFPVAASYSTSAGTATSGTDYTYRSGTLTIPANTTSTQVSVPVVGDTTAEANETFRLTISRIVNAAVGDDQGTATIVDDDSESTLTVTVNGPGHVGSTPVGIDCGSTCVAAFASSTAVSLVATPVAGATFSGWSGDCAGVGDCSLTMDAAHAVTAAFLPRLTISDVSVVETNAGTTVTFQVTLAPAP